jgi:hypothetical protein
VLDAAQGRALHRPAVRLEGVDLGHPAEPVELVGVDGHVKAGVDQVPAVAEPFGADPVAGLLGGRLPGGVFGAEVAVPVLLTGQIGAPGRHPVRAVVEGAHRGVVGLQGGMAGPDRAREPHRGGPGDAPVEPRVDPPPAATDAGDRDHADAVGGQGLVDLFLGHDRVAVGVQDGAVGVLVVEHQQPASAALPAVPEGEEVHAVVVHADLSGLLGGAVGGVLAPRRPARPDRRPPRDQDLGQVAVGDGEGVGAAGRHRREPQQRAAPAAGCARCRHRLPGFAEHARRAQKAGGGDHGAAPQDLASGHPGGQDVPEGPVAGGVGAAIIRVELRERFGADLTVDRHRRTSLCRMAHGPMDRDTPGDRRPMLPIRR